MEHAKIIVRSSGRANDGEVIERAVAARSEAGRLLAEDSERVARMCHAMAERFHLGGKLLVFGNGGSSTDAQHVAVEFVHPVIVGKRALPALALTNDVAAITGAANHAPFSESFIHQLCHLAAPEDIAMGISADGLCGNVLHALEAAHERKLLTIAFCGGDGGAIAGSDAVDFPLIVRSRDPLIVKEVQVTAYHILWELVHVFLEQPGVLQPGFIR
ncbi:MAG: D-sedoheptulose-7-phosphate isomerase [Candidatus Binataceae bacterium]